MPHTLTLQKIAQLAEEISINNFTESGVNLFSIAEKEGITFSYNDYGDYFLGALSHNEGEFHIFINSNLLPEQHGARARFTFAHELGHYFITHHREKLKEGESLTYSPDYTHKLNEPIEREANHFASRLLLPQSKLHEVGEKCELGFPSIFFMKSTFETSIECAALRYVEANLTPCLLIRWRKDYTSKYAPYSQSFSAKFNISGKVSIRINRSMLESKIQQIEVPEGIVENAARLSDWMSSIPPNSANDFTCLEQTIKLGDFGGMTLLLV